MKYKELRDAAHAILVKAEAEGRDLTLEESRKASSYIARAKSLKEDESITEYVANLEKGATTVKGRGASKWGAEFLKTYFEHNPGRKDLTPSGSILVPSLTEHIFRVEDRATNILELIPSTRLEDTDQYSYLRETVRTNNAAPVAQGGVKPTSVYSIVKVDDTVETIAHLSEPIPRQTLSDAALLRQYLDGSLRDGVRLALEDQIVNGTGVSPQLLGLENTPGTLSQAFVTDNLTTTRRALTFMEMQGVLPTAWLMNPEDWEAVELSEDGSGRMYYPGPSGARAVDRERRMLWGYPVASSIVIPQGKAWLIDADGSMVLVERERVMIDWTENIWRPEANLGNGASDFQMNQIVFRAEGRWGFAVTRPRGVCEVALSPGT